MLAAHTYRATKLPLRTANIALAALLMICASRTAYVKPTRIIGTGIGVLVALTRPGRTLRVRIIVKELCQDNGTWCCATGDPDQFARNYNFTCCDISSLTFKAAAVVYAHASVSLAIASLTSSDSSPSGTSFLSSPTTSVQPQPTSLSVSGIAASTTASVTQTAASLNATVTGSKPPALAIGLGVGIPLAIILIAIACFAFWRLGQRQSQRASAQAKEDLAKEYSISEVHSIPTHSVPPLGREQRRTLMSNLEIGGEELKAEMPYSNSPVELEGPTNKLASRPSSVR